MMMEAYKETVIHELENAVDENGVVQIISCSIGQFHEEDLYRYLVVIYLQMLQDGFAEVSGQNADTGKIRNVRSALNYLKQMNENRGKIK